jgi:mycofactocin system glycosyltransferase
MLDLAPLSADLGIRVRLDGYRVDPPVVVLRDPRGHVLTRAGSRRALVVNDAAAEAFRRLAPTGVLSGAVGGRLPQHEARLMDLLAARGLARAERSLEAPFPRVAIIVPTFGRVDGVRRCLASLRDLEYPRDLIDLVIVEDAHPDGARILAEADRVGARTVRRGSNGGPTAARNSGIAATTAQILAFVDSDCVVPADWLARLIPELADPAIWATAGRVRGTADATVIGRYECVRSPLDMGAVAHDLDVADGRHFMPTANVLMTRTGLTTLGGFDETLRIGEDVDLCLRILAAGGRARYLPDVVVGHERRRNLAAFARQRAGYAASEAPLVARHPALARSIPVPAVPAMVAFVLAGWPLGGRVGVRIGLAAGILGTQMLVWRRWSQRAWPGTKPGGWLASIRSTADANAALVDRLVRQFARNHVVPVSLVAGRARPRRTLAIALALLGWSGVSDLVRLRPSLDPVRFVALHAVDDLAYNAGLIVGAIRERAPTAYIGSVRVSSGLPRSEAVANTVTQVARPDPDPEP